MHIVQSVSVKPSLPRSLGGLADLAFNLGWSWLPGAAELFAWIDPELWDDLNHNPIRLLAEIDQRRLDTLAQNADFLAAYAAVMQHFESYVSPQASTWLQQNHPDKLSPGRSLLQCRIWPA